MLTDTSPEAQAVLTAIYRKMTPEEKIHRVFEMTQLTRELALTRIRRSHPEFSEPQARAKLIEEIYGVRPQILPSSDQTRSLLPDEVVLEN